MPHLFRLDPNFPQLALHMAVVLSLLGNAAAATGYFFMVDKIAGYMMVPYIAWLGYANCIGAYLTGYQYATVGTED